MDNERVATQYLLALVAYREAGGEPPEGRLAVMHTILNRAAHPCWWGKTPYEVITAPEQYSSMTHLGDYQTIKFPKLTDLTFAACLQMAGDVLDGQTQHPAPGADSYYASWMDRKGMTPKWADASKFVKQIGNHKFYNLDGDPAIVNAG